jgi:hypothetical protein
VSCIVDNCDIRDSATIKDSLFTLTTSSIDDLIGSDCAEELCVALEKAAEEAEENESTDVIQYLQEKWKNVVQNKYFISWYAYKLQWHFLNGPSISEIISSKLITTSKSDPDYKDDFSAAQENERKRMERASSQRAGLFRDKFLKTYWNKNTNLYDCVEKDCGCKKDYLCEQHNCTDREEGINMWIG